MTITELITKLERLRKTHGDLPVAMLEVYDGNPGDGYTHHLISKVRVRTQIEADTPVDNQVVSLE